MKDSILGIKILTDLKENTAFSQIQSTRISVISPVDLKPADLVEMLSSPGGHGHRADRGQDEGELTQFPKENSGSS